MSRKDLIFILKSFVVWRAGLLAALFLAIKSVPLQANFLGGGLQNYLANPYFWAWGNFDGEHYLAIARFGYQPLTYFFFPLYPLLIKLFGETQLSALVISHLSLIIGLFGFYKLVRLDYSAKIAKLSIILLLAFPTSFFFGGVYTESLFLALAVWFFWFLRKRKWLGVILLGSLASATRLVGAVLLVPFGLLGYMYYLLKTTGDPLAFIHNIALFGGQRSESIVLLPQVFYRYFFKIIPNLNYSYFPALFTAYLELGTAIIFLAIIIFAFKKLKLVYTYYLAAGYLLPTFSGSFSSLARYVLVLFPAFILLAIFLEKRPLFRVVWLVFSLVLLGISVMLFTRGYFIA